MGEQRELVQPQFVGDFSPIDVDGQPRVPEPFVERIGDGMWGVFNGANETWIGPGGHRCASMAGFEWDAEAGNYVRREADAPPKP